MSAQRINVSLPPDVLALLDAHVTGKGARSAYIAQAVRRSLVTDSLARVADHNGGHLPYADELDGIEDNAA